MEPMASLRTPPRFPSSTPSSTPPTPYSSHQPAIYPPYYYSEYYHTPTPQASNNSSYPSWPFQGAQLRAPPSLPYPFQYRILEIGSEKSPSYPRTAQTSQVLSFNTLQPTSSTFEDLKQICHSIPEAVENVIPSFPRFHDLEQTNVVRTGMQLELYHPELKCDALRLGDANPCLDCWSSNSPEADEKFLVKAESGDDIPLLSPPPTEEEEEIKNSEIEEDEKTDFLVAAGPTIHSASTSFSPFQLLSFKARFVLQLFVALENQHIFAPHIAWDQQGAIVIINETKELVDEILPRLFGHDALKAFYHQLAVYSFSQVSPRGSQKREWMHLSFRRCSTYEELSAMRPKEAPGRKAQKEHNTLMRTAYGKTAMARHSSKRNKLSDDYV